MAKLGFSFFILIATILLPTVSMSAPPTSNSSSVKSLNLASSMSNQDEANLLSAIEDYRFNDFDEAIATLEKLHLLFPNNQLTIQYLALSYQESGRSQKAIPLFQAWLTNSGQSTNDNARFAWVGLASAYISAQEYDDAARSLNTWLKRQPQDIAGQIMLGDVYVRDGEDEKADKVWALVLNHEQSNTSQRAAAWYYKAWAAYLDGQDQRSKTLAQKSLDLDDQGAYANAAKQLLAATPRKTSGIAGSASLEAFWSSNVKLLPDYQTSATSSSLGSDNGLQANIALNFKAKPFEANYFLSATKYKEFSEYDILLHVFNGSWSHKKWKFVPNFEWVSLNSEYLYQGFGLGSYYTHQSWAYHYGLKFKTFSHSYGVDAADLSRLNGTNHNLGVSHGFSLAGINTVFASDIFAERTQGDTTHQQTDDYMQIGANLHSTIPLNENIRLATGLMLYNRSYAAPDSSILLNPNDDTKRSDLYTNVTTSVIWQPMPEQPLSLHVNLSWLKNSSNYDESKVVTTGIKSYSTLKIGGMVSTQW